MKLLRIYADRFAWRTAEKGLETAAEESEGRRRGLHAGGAFSFGFQKRGERR